MNKIKAAFFDFDWTLFDHKTRSFIGSAIESIKEIQRNGIKVFINSARSYYSLAGLDTFNLINFDGFVVSNGGACLLENEILYAHYLPETTAEQIIKICEENKISYLLSTTKKSFIREFDKENINSFYEVFYEAYAHPISEYKNEKIMIVQVFCRKEQDYLFSEVKGVFPNRFCEWVTEFCSKEFIKSEGINAIIQKFGLKPDEICAFGDDVNDIDMFKLVKYGVCMGNGKEEAKKYAYHITTNIEDDGIKNGLIHLGLIKKSNAN